MKAWQGGVDGNIAHVADDACLDDGTNVEVALRQDVTVNPIVTTY